MSQEHNPNEPRLFVPRTDLIDFDNVVHDLDGRAQQMERVQKYDEVFAGICSKLWELGISVKATKAYSTYAEEGWHYLYVMETPLVFKYPDGTTKPAEPGIHLIVNHEQVDMESGAPIRKVHDYLMSVHDGTLGCVATEIHQKESETGRSWDCSTDKGPLLMKHGDEMRIYTGSAYADKLFPALLVNHGALEEAEMLTEDLGYFSQAAEDYISKFEDFHTG